MGWAGAPNLPLENYKLSFISKKKNWYELPLRMQSMPDAKSIYILVCASVRTCDDPLESFNLFNLLIP